MQDYEYVPATTEVKPLTSEKKNKDMQRTGSYKEEKNAFIIYYPVLVLHHSQEKE